MLCVFCRRCRSIHKRTLLSLLVLLRVLQEDIVLLSPVRGHPRIQGIRLTVYGWQGLCEHKRARVCRALRAGKFGSSAAVGQILPPKAQMLGRQDWRYVSGGGRALHGAHAADCDVTCLAPSRDGRTLLSRSGDDTLKVRAQGARGGCVCAEHGTVALRA